MMTDGSLLRIPVMDEGYDNGHGYKNLDDLSVKHEDPLLSYDASVQQRDQQMLGLCDGVYVAVTLYVIIVSIIQRLH